jgi:alpha-tubulin suppressor-like RCC1 family protein
MHWLSSRWLGVRQRLGSRHRRALAFAAGTLVGGATVSVEGCLSFQPFSCAADGQCDDREGGICADGNFCAYPDGDCMEAGLRYDEHAGDGLAGECVGEGAGTTTPDPDTGTLGTFDTTNPTTVDPSTTQSTTIDTGTSESEDTGPACGGLGEACCEGDACAAGLACDNDECASCIAAIEAGDRHNCVLRTDGELVCWGANDLGQLGDSDAPFEPLPVLAVATEPDDRIVEVSALRHTCVRSENGNVRCWGDNGANQVDPAPSPAVAPTTPATWAPASLHIATGVSHTCSADGAMTTCWGSNAESQLTSAAVGPGPVVFANPGYEDLLLGGSHSCAVLVDATLSCWGSNSSGQLAQDPTTVPIVVDPAIIVLPAAVDGLALGRQHTCALVDGAVSCWGRNDLGQLGDGSGAQQIAPIATALPPEAGAITSITAGPHHTCALDDADALWCWGSNDNGQLMLEPDKGGNDVYTLVPVPIDLGEGVIAVTSGQTHTCAVTDAARILCWGTNTSGQIGDGTTTFAFEPTQVEFDCG